jgi:Fe-S oxidoreductase
LHDRLVGWLPRYAPYASPLARLLNLRDRLPGAAALSEWIAGFSAQRSLPIWRSRPFREKEVSLDIRGGAEVVLFADTFNRYFEPENLEAALKVLRAAGYRVHLPRAADGGRPLCCGRTFLSVGAVEQARQEAERSIAALEPFAARGVPILGLEPSCTLGFRDEIPALIKGKSAKRLAEHTFLFEEFLAREAAEGDLDLRLKAMPKRALLHGHCHQKSFGAMGAVEAVLKLVPDLKVETIESSCCGMAGSFGYGKDTIRTSLAMGELSLLPAVRKAADGDLIVADGFSCRHQIEDGSGREALHVARVLAENLASA